MSDSLLLQSDPLLYLHLLLLLVGTLLYGFLGRELLRQPEALPGWAPRAFTGALAVFFTLSLLASLATLLVDDAARAAMRASVLKQALDLVRGWAWLLSWPFLVHTCRALPVFDPDHPASPPDGRRPPSRLVALLSWLPLFALVGPSLALLVGPSSPMRQLAWTHYPRLLAHALWSIALAFVLLAGVRRLTTDPHLRQLARSLLGVLGAMFALLLGSGVARYLLEEGVERAEVLGVPTLAGSLWALGVELACLLLGAAFAYFVQRDNLLRLSLSLRSVRHFSTIVGLVVLTLLIGALGGIGDTPSFRRFTALGIVAALVAPLLWTPLVDRASRHPRLRALLGRRVTTPEIERLVGRIRTLDGTEQDLRSITAAEISSWLDTDARFLPVEGGRDIAPDWLERLQRHFAAGGRRFNRLDAPDATLAAALFHGRLHAVLPLTVEERPEWLLALSASRGGGGYQEGEMQALELLLGQLAATVAMRRLTEARLVSERRLADRERLGTLGLVSASLAHELKNPLAAMKSLAQSVHEEIAAESPDSDRAEDLRLIVEQIDRLDEVARETLAFARPAPVVDGEPGRGQIDVSALLLRTLRVLDHEAKRRGIELDRDLVEPGVLARGSAAQWQTATLNLVLNALEHAPAGSRVEVGLRARRRESHDGESAGLEFWTENEGEAIAPELAERLFEPFVGGDRAGSSGLGLALVRQRAAELGAEVTLENRSAAIRFSLRVPESDVPEREHES